MQEDIEFGIVVFARDLDALVVIIAAGGFDGDLQILLRISGGSSDTGCSMLGWKWRKDESI